MSSSLDFAMTLQIQTTMCSLSPTPTPYRISTQCPLQLHYRQSAAHQYLNRLIRPRCPVATPSELHRPRSAITVTAHITPTLTLYTASPHRTLPAVLNTTNSPPLLIVSLILCRPMDRLKRYLIFQEPFALHHTLCHLHSLPLSVAPLMLQVE